MQTRTQKWVKNDLSEDPYRFHHATEAVLRCNGGCFTMQNSLRCSVTQAPLQPKRIFDCVLNLYTFRANFVTSLFSTIYEHAHISPVRTEKNFGSEFLNLRGAIVRIFQKITIKPSLSIMFWPQLR
jgi:hypothetical protein